MLFVQTPGGLSHHPDESVREQDVQAAFEVLLGFLERLDSVAQIAGEGPEEIRAEDEE